MINQFQTIKLKWTKGVFNQRVINLVAQSNFCFTEMILTVSIRMPGNVCVMQVCVYLLRCYQKL